MTTTEDAVTTDFQALQEVGAIPQPPRELDEDELEKLHQAGTVFTVRRVTTEETEKYGTRYHLFCEGPDGTPFLLGFWANAVRDPVVLALQGITKTQPVTGVRLASQKRGKMSMYIPSGHS